MAIGKTKYIAVIKELKDGEMLEVNGHISGLVTVILKNGNIKVAGLVRNTDGEIS